MCQLGCGPAARQQVRGSYQGSRTKIELVRYLSKIPECVPSRVGFESCSWRGIAKDRTVWKQLASESGLTDRLNVVCELPVDGSARSSSSCSIYPRRSVRDSNAASRRDHYGAELRAASTLGDVAAFVGDGPTRCAPSVEDAHDCQWLVSNQSLGWQRLATLAATSRQVQLSCRFSLRTGQTHSNSCQVAERK